MDARLPGGKAHHRQSHGLQGHGAQGDGDLLPGAQEHIHLPLGGTGIDLPSFLDEIIGGVPLGGEDRQHPVPGLISIGDDARHVPDTLRVPDGRAAEFLNNEFHVGNFPSLELICHTLL